MFQFSLHIIVEPRNFQTKSYKKCHVSYSSLSLSEPDGSHLHRSYTLPSSSQMQEHYPVLVTEIDPTDFTRFRYIVTLQSTEGIVVRVRLHQWNVRSRGNLPKDGSAQLAEAVSRIFISSMESTPPDVVYRTSG
jgi:hypothetical protein